MSATPATDVTATVTSPVPTSAPASAEGRSAAAAAAPVTTSSSAPAARPSWAGPRAVGLGLLALGVVAVVATAAIPSARDGWSMSGPRFFPLVASLALVASSAAMLVRTVVRPDMELARHAADEAQATQWRTPALVGGLLLGYVALFEPVGYIVSTTAFFALAARVLGSRSPVRDVVAGLALAVAADFLFTQLLAVRLPAGLVGF